MAKPKQRQVVKIPGTKLHGTESGLDTDNMSGEDNWVMVKKQKFTIWIPPLPVIEPEEIQQLPRPPTNQSQQFIVDLQAHSDSDMEKSMPSLTEKAIPKAPKLDHKRIQGVHKITRRVCNYPEVSKSYRNFLIGDEYSLNKGLRARNLERKIQIAGGLSRWLVSMGLDRFVKLFEGKSVGKFQLANLTMKKLKDIWVQMQWGPGENLCMLSIAFVNPISLRLYEFCSLWLSKYNCGVLLEV